MSSSPLDLDPAVERKLEVAAENARIHLAALKPKLENGEYLMPWHKPGYKIPKPPHSNKSEFEARQGSTFLDAVLPRKWVDKLTLRSSWENTATCQTWRTLKKQPGDADTKCTLTTGWVRGDGRVLQVLEHDDRDHPCFSYFHGKTAQVIDGYLKGATNDYEYPTKKEDQC